MVTRLVLCVYLNTFSKLATLRTSGFWANITPLPVLSSKTATSSKLVSR